MKAFMPHALTNLTDRWLKYIDDGNLVGTIFLDLKKAFDMVDHKHLCKQLQYYKISTNSMKWFESYFLTYHSEHRIYVLETTSLTPNL